ncbi:MAG: c-type cytochrome [Gammaproteobacteria bacterium]|nr:c-type cytochrome [Gammaproteobacteria bacterium]
MRLAAAAGWMAAAGLAALLAAVAAGAVSGADEARRARAAQPDLVHGAQLFAACVACHGSDGAGEPGGSVPRIAGQHASVLIKEISDFRRRRRWDLRMEQMAGSHRLERAQDVADVAAYLASLDADVHPAIGDGRYLQRGAAAYLRVCAGCHGASGQGDAGALIPRLAGQHAPYLLRQMQESATSGRPNMSASHVQALRALSYEDFTGAADYLARMRPRIQPATAE